MTVPTRVNCLKFIWYSKRIPSNPMVRRNIIFMLFWCFMLFVIAATLRVILRLLVASYVPDARNKCALEEMVWNVFLILR